MSAGLNISQLPHRLLWREHWAPSLLEGHWVAPKKMCFKYTEQEVAQPSNIDKARNIVSSGSVS